MLNSPDQKLINDLQNEVANLKALNESIKKDRDNLESAFKNELEKNIKLSSENKNLEGLFNEADAEISRLNNINMDILLKKEAFAHSMRSHELEIVNLNNLLKRKDLEIESLLEKNYKLTLDILNTDKKDFTQETPKEIDFKLSDNLTASQELDNLIKCLEFGVQQINVYSKQFLNNQTRFFIEKIIVNDIYSFDLVILLKTIRKKLNSGDDLELMNLEIKTQDKDILKLQKELDRQKKGNKTLSQKYSLALNYIKNLENNNFPMIEVKPAQPIQNLFNSSKDENDLDQLLDLLQDICKGKVQIFRDENNELNINFPEKFICITEQENKLKDELIDKLDLECTKYADQAREALQVQEVIKSSYEKEIRDLQKKLNKSMNQFNFIQDICRYSVELGQ